MFSFREMKLQKLNLKCTLTYLVVFLCPVLTGTGCTTKVNQDQSPSFSQREPKQFNIVTKDVSGKRITDQQILEAIQQQTYLLTKYDNQTDSSDKFAHNERGFNAVINEDKIGLVYFNGTVSSRFKRISTVKANIQVQIISSGTNTVVTLYPPDEYRVSRARGSFLLSTINLLDTENNLIDDMNNIYDKINLNIFRLMFISGSFIVENDSEDVYENFEQKLGLYQQGSFQEARTKHGIFSLKNGSTTIPLRLAISPKKNGTLISYEFDINYTITSIGKQQFKREHVKTLVNTIKHIAVLTNLDDEINSSAQITSGIVKIVEEPEIITYKELQENKNQVNSVNNTNKTNSTKLKKTVAVSNKKSKKKNTNKTAKKTVKKTTKRAAKKTTKKSTSKTTNTDIAVKPLKLKKTTIEDTQANEQKTEATSKQVSVTDTTNKNNSNMKNIEYIEKMLKLMKTNTARDSNF